MSRSVPPPCSSRWTWLLWWLNLILLYALYIAMAYVAIHFVRKFW